MLGWWVGWAAPLKWSAHQGVAPHHPPPLTLLCTHGQGYGRSPDAAIAVKVLELSLPGGKRANF